MKTTLIFLNILTALIAIVSAYCWYKSSIVAVKHENLSNAPDGAYRDATVVTDGNDFFATFKLQSVWNKRAATAAAFAALAQGAVAGLGVFAG